MPAVGESITVLAQRFDARHLGATIFELLIDFSRTWFDSTQQGLAQMRVPLSVTGPSRWRLCASVSIWEMVPATGV